MRVALLVALLARIAHAECPEMAPLTRLLADAKAAHARGAMFASDVGALAAAPFNKHPAPQGPSLTVRITARGFVAGREGPTDDFARLLKMNPNIEWERTHKEAALHGVALEVEAAAPAKLVQTALTTLAGDKIAQVWLVFRPAQPLTAPAASPLDAELTGRSVGPEEVTRIVGVIQREVATCPAVRTLFGRMSGYLLDGKMKTMVEKSSAALEECGCKMKPATLASMWWNLSFKDLGVAVPVDPARVLPLGAGTWGEAAPSVLAVLQP